MLIASLAPAQPASPSFSIFKATLSPDGRYGVTVPTLEEMDKNPDADNALVEVATKRLILLFAGATGIQSAARHTPHADWSADSSVLLWTVEGKWFPDGYTLVKIEDGKLAWQLDLLKTLQQAILQRTQQASPDTYAIKKAEAKGNGSAYPDGFTVFVDADQNKGDATIALPLVVPALLTSDPKESRLPHYPGTSSPFNLESELDGVVDASGKFTVTHFKLLQAGMARKK